MSHVRLTQRALVDPVTYRRKERETWSKAEVRKLLRGIDGERLEVAWRLSLYGLRRGKVLGLRWEDVDLKAGALERLRKAQVAESERAGTAYRDGLQGLQWYGGGEYLVTDELGIPVHPEWYSDEFGRVLRSMGLRRIALHDSRHTTLSLMEKPACPSP